MGGCKNVKGGNPKLTIPSSIENSFTKIELPGRFNLGTFEPITNPNYYEPRNVIGGALYLKEVVNNAVCDSIPRNGEYTEVIGNLADGSGQVWYMNYIELDENTIENPIPDGGRTVMGTGDRSLMLGIHNVGYDGFYCPMATKNFKNSKFHKDSIHLLCCYGNRTLKV